MRAILRSIPIALFVFRRTLFMVRIFTGLGFTRPSKNTISDLKKYLLDFREFRKLGGLITRIFPICNEHRESAGIIGGHYFHQDLLVAQFIQEENPRMHIDFGSRIDGFVAHVASFREIQVFDIRELSLSAHLRIKFQQFDLMKAIDLKPVADSISCLHTIEHIGLGRYGDDIDPNGHKKGFQNLLNLLEAEGTLYVSFPIGKVTSVHFNAHRIFHPREILTWTEGKLDLIRFDLVDDHGDLHKNVDLSVIEHNYDFEYGCGIYTFRKRSVRSQ
jgi:hypothetical protein